MKALFVIVGLALSAHALAGTELDFDWDDKNDMRGAWSMCVTTGFTGGDCPKVYTQCWKPPMIYRKKHKIKTYCVDTPSFSVSDSDKDRYLEEANKRAQDDSD